MSSPALLHAARSRVVFVDLQERLLAGLTDGEDVLQRCVAIAEASREFGVPCVASEQSPGKLGGTASSLAAMIDDRRPKDAFSAAEAVDIGLCTGGLSETATDRDQVVLCGVETAVCVLQTAADLIDDGWSVFVVADASASRRACDQDVALHRLRDLGATVVTTDMVLFEWAGRAGTDAFRIVSRLVKSLPA